MQLVDKAANHVEKVFPHLVQVKSEKKVETVERVQPLRVRHREVCSRVRALRFHPQKEFHSRAVRGFHDVLKAVRMFVGTHLPVSDLLVPVACRGNASLSVPARVDPVVIGLYAVFRELPDMEEMLVRRHSHALKRERVLLRPVRAELVFHKPAEHVAAVRLRAGVFEKKNGRRADALARMQLERSVLDAGADLYDLAVKVRERRLPLTRPAHCGNNSASRDVDVEKGHHSAGRPASPRVVAS